uniref:Coiled-coil domain-containing protein 181 n=1 Tax=Malurus cyaneus samueli TaxID=2593467 RepID=A0A8C5U8S0_9PASS
MSEKEYQEDLTDMGDSTENEEYEDDFEKELEYLTDDEEKQDPGEREVFVTSNAKMEGNLDQHSEAAIENVNVKTIYSNKKYLESGTDTEQEDHESDPERESFIQESRLGNEQGPYEEEDEEIKRYVLGKIEEANKELKNQAPVDKNRERKLKFKDELLALQAPLPEDVEFGKTDHSKGDDLSFGLSQLLISNDIGQKRPPLLTRGGSEEETSDYSKLLVEKAGKFELLGLYDIESRCISPPISVCFTDIETSSKSSDYYSSDSQGMPPCDCQLPPDSALNGTKDLGKGKSPRKTQSSKTSVKSSTYGLTPKQKELRRQIEIRNERRRIEEEIRQKELEEERRRENDIVFRAWLQKKKIQVQEEKRIRRAKQLEELSIREVTRDPEEAYRLWLKKKHLQYVKEKQLDLLRRQTQEMQYYPRIEDSDKAFKDWLRRKREEKLAAEQAAKESARQLKLEFRDKILLPQRPLQLKI